MNVLQMAVRRGFHAVDGGSFQGVDCDRSSAWRLCGRISGGLPQANAATDGGRNAPRAVHCNTTESC